MAQTGTATLNFGTGSNIASVAVTGQSGIGSGSNVEAWLMTDSTSDNNAFQHQVVDMRLRCGNIVPGTGFTIFALSPWTLFQTWQVRWVWS